MQSSGGSSSGGGSLKLHQHFEGQLNKYTNVMKGWQHRWFVLNPDKGTLEYHVSESDIKGQYRPRGFLHLAGAVISPSEEDSHSFSVNSASGDVYKLRALDAKERQEWITRLRVVAELHSQALFTQSNSQLVSREHGSSSSRVPCNLSILDAFAQVQEWLQRAELSAREIGQLVDKFPISGPGIKSTDQELLTLKATSQATIGSLEECFYALHLQQRETSSLAKPPHRTQSSSTLPDLNSLPSMSTVNLHKAASYSVSSPPTSGSSLKLNSSSPIPGVTNSQRQFHHSHSHHERKSSDSSNKISSVSVSSTSTLN